MTSTVNNAVADLQRANAELQRQLDEALSRETATADILQVISGSPTDVQPTFDAIAARANVVCGATSDGVFRFDGSRIHLVGHNGWTRAEFEAIRDTFPLSPGRGSVTARAILTRQFAHVHDIAADPEYAAMSIARSGLRTVLSVPMLRDGEPIGCDYRRPARGPSFFRK
jgi:two-component system, NtrC family, sensor kinase